MRKTRSKQGGSRKVRFTEGWVEFKDKRIAKRVAAALNNTQIGTLCFLCVFFFSSSTSNSFFKETKEVYYIYCTVHKNGLLQLLSLQLRVACAKAIIR